ncbi:PIN domain-containing protein [candidate division KSB1 bacterium]|nr:PIN domain-containing protein [candidate division KSB1 bacterium]
MILIDAGPIIALLDRHDNHHHECVEASKALAAEPLLTTWPCFTEAMYLLGAVGGYRFQIELWKFIEEQQLTLHDLTAIEIARMRELMEKYQDTPMDLADASIVTVAESHSIRDVFTLDSDFRIYRLADGSNLNIIP